MTCCTLSTILCQDKACKGGSAIPMAFDVTMKKRNKDEQIRIFFIWNLHKVYENISKFIVISVHTENSYELKIYLYNKNILRYSMYNKGILIK